LKKCRYCGKFHNNKTYCSKECHIEGQKGKNNPNYRHIKLICQYCKKEFWKPPRFKKQKFCSNKCSSKFFTGKNHPQYKGKEIYICGYCGKSFEIYASERKRKIKLCSNKCFHQWYRGENCYQWDGGKKFELYSSEFNNKLKEHIRQRDNYKCQLCGVPQVEYLRKLDVHHINYDKKNNKFDNLISLCKSCHSRTNHNRRYWIKYFKNNRRMYAKI